MHRLKQIQQRIKKSKTGAILISRPENIRYLCGFIGTNGQLLISPKKVWLITDFRYFRSAKKQIHPSIEIFDQSKGIGQLLNRYKRVGVEEAHLTHSVYLRLKKLLKGTKLISISGWVEEMRMIKSKGEIKIIKKAIKTANHIFESFVKTIRAGQSEDEMEWQLLCEARKRGVSEGFSFPPIIAFGKDTADVHHVKGRSKLKRGQSILIDFGIVYEGYMTDMTRVLFTQPPSEIEQKIYSIVLEANQKAIQSIQVGKKCSEIDRVARQIIEDAGYGEYFGHSTGHGVGIEIHESPSLSSHSSIVIQPGMVITVEPGIYTPHHGGVRIEDMVYINEKGRAEVLTQSVSKQIRII